MTPHAKGPVMKAHLERLLAGFTASSVTTESRATFVAVASIGVGFLAGVLVVNERSLDISGAGSLGAITGVIAAIVAFAAFALGFLVPAPGARRRTHPETRTWRLIVNLIALGIAHAAITLLLLVGLSIVFADAFIGAEVFAFSSALIVALASGLVGYASFLSGAGLTTGRIASVLAIYLVVGVMAAMLSTSDPQWWEQNISALGIGGGYSSAIFNFTLIVAGVLITAIAVYLAAELRTTHLARAASDTDPALAARRIQILQWGLGGLGVFLMGVGVFPVNWLDWLHNTFASGLVVIFAALIAGIRWLIPGLPLVFVAVGYGFLAIVVGATVFFFLGIYTLTAMEIVGFALIFTWLILLIRNVSAGGADAARTTYMEQPHP